MVVIVGVAAAVIVSLNGGKGGKSSTGNKKGNVQVSDNTNNNVGESQPPETAPPTDARASAIALANRTEPCMTMIRQLRWSKPWMVMIRTVNYSSL